MERKSIFSLSLKRRIWVAVALVSFIPVVVLSYYFFGYHISLWATLILVVVVFLGWKVVFETSAAVVKVYQRSKKTIDDIGVEDPSVSDEVQSLDAIINLLSEKVKGGFEQLKDFTEKTEQLNKEVSRKVLTLTTILQANDLFSKDTPAEEVIKFLCYHAKMLLGVEKVFCVLRRVGSNEIKPIACQEIETAAIDAAIAKTQEHLPRLKHSLIINSRDKAGRYLPWLSELGVGNLILVPVITKEHVMGLVGIANANSLISDSKENLEVLNLFSQNIALIWEHERLSSKVESLEIRDGLTGLYNERMLSRRLDEEIRRAMIYQRPCSLLAVGIANYREYQKKAGSIEIEKLLKVIAQALKDFLRPIDIAGRISSNSLGAVLIENNRRKSQEVADKLKKALKKICKDEVKLVFTVAESPINGANAKELMGFVQKERE